MVNATNDEELKQEMDKEQTRLCCAYFWCCIWQAVQGIKQLKRAREYASKGQDVEARDSLLDAKISCNTSSLVGSIFCWSLSGMLLFVALPFIWIPLPHSSCLNVTIERANVVVP